MNSMRFIQQAIDYEAKRQVGILEDDGKIIQETRLYDPYAGKTKSMSCFGFSRNGTVKPLC